ncbi:hypothetical protein [Vibrio rumoiensis]|uniref:hypothetical protein n=1 Tax=Vibrio rumoiensis TaxID=76258 RepID=UPI003AA9D186
MACKTTQPVKNKVCRRRRPINVIPSDFEKDEEIKKIIDEGNPFPAQRDAVIETLRKYSQGKALIYLIMAQTQSGKSTTSAILARILNYYMTKASLPVTCDAITKPFTVIYLIALPQNDLETQAKQMFDVRVHILNAGVTVMKMLNINKLISELNKLGVTPGAFIVDESHLANSPEGSNFPKLMRILKKEWKKTPLFCISATPHSLLNGIEKTNYIPSLNCDFEIVVQHPGQGYRGIREYYSNNQIIELGKANRDITRSSEFQELFFKHIQTSHNRVSFIRVTAGKAPAAIELIKQRVQNAKVVLLGKTWKGVNEVEMSTLDELRTLHANLQTAVNDQETKIVVLVRAGLSAGIDLGENIKSDVSGVWECYRSSLASILQGVLARCCGYVDNQELLAFVHFPHLKLYVDALIELYDHSNIKTMQEFLHNIAPEHYIKVDSEKPQSKKQSKSVREIFHDIEYITTLDITNSPNFDTTELALSASGKLNDKRLSNVIQSSVNKYILNENVNDPKVNHLYGGGENLAIRYIGHNYVFGTKHSYMSRFQAMKKGTISRVEKSFEKFGQIGQKASDSKREYVVLVCSSSMTKKKPLHPHQIKDIVDSLSNVGPQFYSCKNKSKINEMVLIIAKRGKPFLHTKDSAIDTAPSIFE